MDYIRENPVQDSIRIVEITQVGIQNAKTRQLNQEIQVLLPKQTAVLLQTSAPQHPQTAQNALLSSREQAYAHQPILMITKTYPGNPQSGNGLSIDQSFLDNMDSPVTTVVSPHSNFAFVDMCQDAARLGRYYPSSRYPSDEYTLNKRIFNSLDRQLNDESCDY